MYPRECRAFQRADWTHIACRLSSSLKQKFLDILSLLKAIACLIALHPNIADAQSAVHERDEVVEIFKVLIPKMDVRTGDGLGSNVACVFARSWDPSFHRDASEQFQPREAISFEEALDPSGQHKDMFCDYAERDAEAQRSASIDQKDVTTASVGFSYPDFGADLQTAVVYYQRWSQLFVPGKKKMLPVGSNGIIRFHKTAGVWAFELKNTGTMN